MVGNKKIFCHFPLYSLPHLCPSPTSARGLWDSQDLRSSATSPQQDCCQHPAKFTRTLPWAAVTALVTVQLTSNKAQNTSFSTALKTSRHTKEAASLPQAVYFCLALVIIGPQKFKALAFERIMVFPRLKGTTFFFFFFGGGVVHKIVVSFLMPN